eukprot:gene11113-19985_t
MSLVPTRNTMQPGTVDTSKIPGCGPKLTKEELVKGALPPQNLPIRNSDLGPNTKKIEHQRVSKHILPMQADPSAQKEDSSPFPSKEYTRAVKCEILIPEGDKVCGACLERARCEEHATKRKQRRLAVPPKLKAPLIMSDSENESVGSVVEVISLEGSSFEDHYGIVNLGGAVRPYQS